MLSLQQTQRFADALGAAELVRQAHDIGGDAFSVGFFVGQGATPNEIKADPKEGDCDPDLLEEGEYQVLMRCPFCRSDKVTTVFDRRQWRLNHLCRAPDCCWKGEPLPFFVVDQEIYRFLPTVVVGNGRFVPACATTRPMATDTDTYEFPLKLRVPKEAFTIVAPEPATVTQRTR
jgi:hypothetical protein